MILQDNPIQEEYKTVTKILKTQRELLQVGDQEQPVPFTCIMNEFKQFCVVLFFRQQDYHQGRDASRQLLMALLRSLWKYFMFHSQGRICFTTNFTR